MNIIITGGSGFVGCNLANYLIARGHKVVVFDNLSRKGAEKNQQWLGKQHGGKVKFINKDITDFADIKKAVADMDVVFHLAAQVAVTTSVTDPRTDFEKNCLGTFNVIEAVRQMKKKPIVLFTSTNKVYGGMEDVKIAKKKDRYEYKDFKNGISEERVLDFHSPYGCSKGSADQYVRDYGRIYGIDTIVFRMSCIYGYRQFGNEDQGWVAHFIISSILGKPLTIYGDGKQIRDILFVEDLIKAMEMAINNIKKTSGKIYNIGGGPKNTLSLLELVGFLEKKIGKRLEVSFDDWRPGDQPVYVSDIRKIGKEIGWQPTIGVEKGIDKLFKWVEANKRMF